MFSRILFFSLVYFDSKAALSFNVALVVSLAVLSELRFRMSATLIGSLNEKAFCLSAFLSENKFRFLVISACFWLFRILLSRGVGYASFPLFESRDANSRWRLANSSFRAFSFFISLGSLAVTSFCCALASLNFSLSCSFSYSFYWSMYWYSCSLRITSRGACLASASFSILKWPGST